MRHSIIINYNKECQNCKKKFTGKKGNEKYCSVSCRQVKKLERVREKRRKPKVIRKCKHCNKEFETSVANKMYCCVEHYQKEYIKTEEYRVYNIKHIVKSQQRKREIGFKYDSIATHKSYLKYRDVILAINRSRQLRFPNNEKEAIKSLTKEIKILGKEKKRLILKMR